MGLAKSFSEYITRPQKLEARWQEAPLASRTCFNTKIYVRGARKFFEYLDVCGPLGTPSPTLHGKPKNICTAPAIVHGKERLAEDVQGFRLCCGSCKPGCPAPTVHPLPVFKMAMSVYKNIEPR